MAIQEILPYAGGAGLILAGMTFWWLNVRKGSILVEIPRSYGLIQGPRGFYLFLPISMRNTGGKPRPISSLRVRVGENGDVMVPHVQNRPQMRLDETPPQYATNFIVPNRGAMALNCEFSRQDEHRDLFVGGHNSVTLEMLTEEDAEWHAIREFEIYVDPGHLPQMGRQYLVYDNLLALPGQPLDDEN